MRETPLKCRHCGHRLVDVDGELKHLKLVTDWGMYVEVARVCPVHFPARGGKPCGCDRPEKGKAKSILAKLRNI
jgi:hypothetical protein